MESLLCDDNSAQRRMEKLIRDTIEHGDKELF